MPPPAALLCSPILPRLSWYQLQLVAQDPAVLAFMGFYPKPVRRRNHDQNLSSGRQGLQSACGVEGRGLECSSRRFHQTLYLPPKVLNPLLQSLRRCRRACVWRRVSAGGVRQGRRRDSGSRLVDQGGHLRIRRLLLLFLLSLEGLGFHRLNGVQVVVDVLVLGALDGSIRRVHDVAEILNKARIDVKHSVLVALGLHYVADDQRPDVSSVLEVSRVDSLQAHLVENLAALSPLGEHLGRSGRGRTGDVLVFVVFLGSPDEPVLDYVLHNLADLVLAERKVHDQAHAVLGGVLLPGGQSECGDREDQDCGGFPQGNRGQAWGSARAPELLGNEFRVPHEISPVGPRVSTLTRLCQPHLRALTLKKKR